jgi:hypothetical protein
MHSRLVIWLSLKINARRRQYCRIDKIGCLKMQIK